MSKKLLILFSVVAMLAACGKLVDEETYALGAPSDDILTAKIDTLDFEFVAGRARPSPFDPTMLTIDIFGSAPTTNVCLYNPPERESKIMFSVPKMAGTYNLGLNTGQTLTFYIGHLNEYRNQVATAGTIILTAINTNNVVGKLKAEVDTRTHADGRFFLTLCP